MKITIYELLGIVKDKVDIDTYIRYYDKLDNKTDVMLACKENIIYNLDRTSIELNDEVEILEEKEICHKCHKHPAEYNQTYCEFCLGISKLEEEKKIPEKLPLIGNKIVNYPDDEFIEKLFNLFYQFDDEIRHKINEIIDYLDYLKSKGDE